MKREELISSSDLMFVDMHMRGEELILLQALMLKFRAMSFDGSGQVTIAIIKCTSSARPLPRCCIVIPESCSPFCDRLRLAWIYDGMRVRTGQKRRDLEVLESIGYRPHCPCPISHYREKTSQEGA